MQAFQTAMVRLVAEPEFRDAVRASGAAMLPPGLSAIEQSRLCRIAADAGLDVNRTLHKGFRLGKLRSMLPLTCRLLGAKHLTREVAAFWATHPPSSFYYIPEALAFCDHLGARRLRIKYLDEVLAYERATLELERARTGTAPPQRVRFRHDPGRLLELLASCRKPRGVAARGCTAVGTKQGDDPIRWSLIDDDPARAG
jgi:hypothetical protein